MDNKKRVNNIIRIPASLKGSFFRYWLEFLSPFHGMTKRELDVATEFIRHRYELSKAIKDEELLDKIVMNEDTKRTIRKDCHFETPHFQIIMGKLRKANFIVDGKINSKFIPKNIEEGDNSFQLLLYFDFDEK